MRKLLFQNIRVIDSNASSDTFKDVLVGEKNIVGVDKPFSIRNSNFKYGEFLFDFKTRKFRSLKMIRQIIQNILYSFINLLFFKKESLLNNLSNIYGIYKFIIFFLIRHK